MTPQETLEFAISQTVEFFSHFDNKTPRVIEEIFMPQLLKHSKTFNQGLTLDLMKFKSLNMNQQLYFKSIFPHADTIRISTENVEESQIFYFLKQFNELKTLKLSLKGDTVFNFPLRKSQFEQIKIECITGEFWLSPVEHILNHNKEILKVISLYNAFITKDLIIAIKQNTHLIKLNLTNPKFFQPNEVKDLISHFVNCDLKTLKLIYCEKTHEITHFSIATNLLFEALTKNWSVYNLSLTINQNTKKNFFEKMKYFPYLNNLEIYYTVEFDLENIFEFINVLKKLHDDRSINIAKIDFIEYYANKQHLKQLNREQKIALIEKSEGLRHDILSKSFKIFCVKTFQFIK